MAMWQALALAAGIWCGDDAPKAGAKPADDANDPAMAALQQVQDIVGQWEGEGAKADKSAVWAEEMTFSWKFAKTGKMSLYAKFKDGKDDQPGRYFDEAAILFDPATSKYVLKAYRKGAEEPLEFVGQRHESGLRFDRVKKGAAKDDFDRIEWKLLNDGDRVVYSVARKLGKTYRPIASVGLNRQGTTIAAKEGGNGPKCIVTGGAGTMAVSHEGQTYYVCCTGCRDAFNADPQKFIARAKAKEAEAAKKAGG